MPSRKKKRRSRARHSTVLPKGAMRLPDGGYVLHRELVRPTTVVDGKGRGLQVVAVYREHPDVQALARVAIQVAEQRLGDHALADSDIDDATSARAA